MQADVPKQYLVVKGKTILEHTLGHFYSHPRIAGLVVVVAPADNIWPTLEMSSYQKVISAVGGDERCHSVLNGLMTLADKADLDDWVLVHDAARPCVHRQEIDRLIAGVSGHDVGGLLGLPVKDTVKYVDDSLMVRETVGHGNLWRALTPQMFRLRILMRCLQDAIAGGHLVRDEAQAVELGNLPVAMVEGFSDNIKITDKNDLAFAELYLSRQEVD